MKSQFEKDLETEPIIFRLFVYLVIGWSYMFNYVKYHIIYFFKRLK